MGKRTANLFQLMRRYDLIVAAEYAWRHLAQDGKVIAASRLTQIGQGGSYRIFRVPETTDLVVKLPYQDSSLPFDVDQLNLDYNRLYDALPESSAPQLAYRAQYRWLEGGPVIDGHAIFQPFDHWIRTPTTLSLNMDYLESTLTQERLEEYHQLNEDLLADPPGSWRTGLAWMPCIKAIDETESRQPGLVAAIAQLLPPLVRLMDELDQLVDLVGCFNLYARHDASAGWMLHAGTVLKYNRMSRTRTLLQSFPDTRAGVEALDLRDRSLLMNALAVLRLINALALRSGINAPFMGLLQPSQRHALAYLRFGASVANYP
jgi:hypothetical protein